MAPNTNVSWMTRSETLLRLGLGGFGDVKWAWGGDWCQQTKMKKELKQITNPKKKKPTRQETKRKKQQAQTERSQRRSHTKSLYERGFCEENTRDKKKIKGASRKP